MVQNFGIISEMTTLEYRSATLAKGLAEKLSKHELDLKFLVRACDILAYPQFTRWKNVKNNNKAI